MMGALFVIIPFTLFAILLVGFFDYFNRAIKNFREHNFVKATKLVFMTIFLGIMTGFLGWAIFTFSRTAGA